MIFKMGKKTGFPLDVKHQLHLDFEHEGADSCEKVINSNTKLCGAINSVVVEKFSSIGST